MTQKYIVDDIVMYKNRIHTIIDTLGLNNYELSYVRHPVNRAELSGVPLTKEILEKNGWKKSKINDCAYFYYKDELFLTYTSKDDKFWFDDFDYSSSICVELPYVHSLQHLLFSLGLNTEMEVQVWKIIVNIAIKGIAHCKGLLVLMTRTTLAS